MLQPVDGPSTQGNVSVDTTTPQELKVGASRLTERKIVTLQPLDGKVWVYFGEEGVTPSAANLQDNGFEVAKKEKASFEVGERQPLWVLSQSGTTDVRYAERA